MDPRVYPSVWYFSKLCKIPVRPSPVTPCSTVQLANYLTLLLILYICLTIEISNSLAVHLFKCQTVLLFNNTASQLSKFPSVNLSNCQATSGLFCFTLVKNYYRQACPLRIFFWEKHRRQTEKLKRSAPSEVVQPLPNLPAPAEVCPAPVSTAEVCSSWTQKSSRRRNFYTVNAPKFT